MYLNKGILSMFRDYFNFTHNDIKTFKSNPRNLEMLSKVPKLMNYVFVVEILESKGCYNQQRTGDKYYFDGTGGLITEISAKRVCVHAMSALSKIIFAANELFYAGIDPDEMRFKRVCCTDVGVVCGGFGHIVMEFSVADRNSHRTNHYNLFNIIKDT